MTEEIITPAVKPKKQKKPSRIQKTIHWVQNNPVIIKEMFGRMRGWRAFLTITIFVSLLAAIVSMIYLGIYASQSASPSIAGRKEVGQNIFYTIYFFELIGICLIAPTLTANAISLERENQTYDLIRTTLLTARSLVLGKLIAAVSYAILIIIATLPVLSIAFMFGGISFSEFAIGTLIQIISAFTFSSIALFFSSFIRRSRVSTVLGQSTTGFFLFALPMLLFFGWVMVDAVFINTPSNIAQIILGVIGWLAVSLSPLTTSIASGIVLADSQNIFYTSTVVGGINIFIPAPWIGFIIFYVLITILMINWTVHIVRRPEK